MVKLNPDNIPRPLVPLIPIAEKWAVPESERGIGYLDAVSSASSEELESLVHCTDDVAEDLFGWLAGPEADDPKNMSLEYVVFDDLSRVVDLAGILLEERQGLNPVSPEESKERMEGLRSLVKEVLRKLE